MGKTKGGSVPQWSVESSWLILTGMPTVMYVLTEQLAPAHGKHD